VNVRSANPIDEHYQGPTTNKITHLNKRNSDEGLARVPV
jgi:hypothetical protein